MPPRKLVDRVSLHGLFDRKRWSGPVARRDPDAVRQPSRVEFWRCGDGAGWHWTPLGSRAMGRCLTCGEPMPAHAREGRPFP